MEIEYLYDPEIVTKVLKTYPLLFHKLNPAWEGQKALSFSKLRKTRREIYRILSNQHYPRLANVLAILEHCLAMEWENPTLLRTRAKTNFESALSELFVAESFLQRGFTIQGFEKQKGSDLVPDMLVQLGDISLSAEVYSPIDWDGYNCFLDELRFAIQHLDVPWNYRFEIKMGLISHFDSREKILRFDPWKFSDANTRPADRWKTINRIISLIKRELSITGRREIISCLQNENLNIFTEVRLLQIQKCQSDKPVRKGVGSHPTLSGHAPEWMFDNLVKRGILNKIKKGQAQSLKGNHSSALIIDVSRLGYTTEFVHSWYLHQFGQSLQRYLKLHTVDVDLAVFYNPGLVVGADMTIPLLYRKSSFPDASFRRLFGTQHQFDALSEEVFIASVKEQDRSNN